VPLKLFCAYEAAVLVVIKVSLYQSRYKGYSKLRAHTIPRVTAGP